MISRRMTDNDKKKANLIKNGQLEFVSIPGLKM